MFDIGGGEIVGLALLGLLLFGPDRLPNLAKDAAATVKKLRAFTSTATTELRENLNLDDLSDLEPKNLIRRHLIDDESSKPASNRPAIDPDAT